jgi:hypothetical protein
VKVDVKALVSQESLGDGVDLAKEKLSKDQLSRLKNTLKDHAPLAALIPPFYGTIPNEELRARVVVDRLLGSGDQSRVVRNLVSDLDETQFRRLSAFLDEVLGVRLTYRTQGDDLLRESPLVLRFRDTNGDIEVASAGAGLVNLVALFAALSRWQAESKRRNVLFLIDEPEAHLHPRLQVQSVARLASLVTEQFGAQLFLATHSVDILNHLSGAGACLLRCDRTANPSAVSLTHEAALFDDIAQWADLTPYTAINALASRRILFCEGDVDAKLLPLLGALRFRDDPRRAELLRRWTFVRLHGTGNAKLAPLLDDLLSDELVRAGLKDSPLRLLVVLDRDHARTPGRVAANPERPHAQTLVWSRHSLESLFLDERTLAPWLRALFKALGADPHAAPTAAIAQALLDADQDQDLCDRATEQLTAKIISAEQRDPQGKRGDALAVYAVREATERVRAEPAVWQRGKDRARRVLGALREASPVGVRNQFPTDLARFVERACAELGDPVGAVPSELNELFAYMAAP